ncbi:GtrA family protein [Stenotrophomonas rhizophila]
MISKRFIMFIVSGGIAAGANFCSRIVFSLWLPYSVSIVLGFMVGLVAAFILMRKLAFTETSNAPHSQVMWFLVVNAFALVQTFCVSLLFARWLLPMMGVTRGAETIAHAIGVATPVLTSYIGHKRLSFRS